LGSKAANNKQKRPQLSNKATPISKTEPSYGFLAPQVQKGHTLKKQLKQSLNLGKLNKST
jgi:hypothetical protein